MRVSSPLANNHEHQRNTLGNQRMDKDFHIALAYQEPIITPDVVEGFEENIQSPGLKVLVRSVPMMGARAAFEWLVPTAIVAYITKPYFDSFLGEMGKDHYAILKEALQKLWVRIVEKIGGRLQLVGSKNKLRDEAHTFSPVFSIEAQSPYEYRIKLLIQSDIHPEQFGRAIEIFLSLLSASYDTKELCEEDKSLLNNKPIGSVLLVYFDPETDALACFNSLPEDKRS